MKILSIVILFFVLSIQNNYGQEFDRCWPLGDIPFFAPRQETNLVFIGNSIRIDTVFRNIKFTGSNTSISDSLGNMKFYSNGCIVATSLNDTMIYGDSISPGICPNSYCASSGGIVTQGSLLLPDPSSPNKFYLLHQPCNNSATGSPVELYNSVIDISQDSGRGAVISKNNLLYSQAMCDGTLTAVKCADGKNWWIVVHEKYSNRFIRFVLSGTGISGPSSQSIGVNYTDDSHGTSRFSPDGKWFASGTNEGGVDLFKFDRCSGLMSNPLHFPIANWANSVEFSPNSRFLYTVWLETIYQFDLLTANILTSGILVATNDTFISHTTTTFFYIPQLGPNGKIYISCVPSNSYLHVIDSPDSLGIACNVLQHSIAIPCSNESIPYFPSYRLGPLDSLYCDTVNLIHESNLQKNSVQLFPNPAGDRATLDYHLRNIHEANFVFTDILGKTIIKQKLPEEDGKLEIDFSSIKAGLYLYHLELDGILLKGVLFSVVK